MFLTPDSGDKCDSCARNHYDITAGCKKCDACYNLVEHTYNQHKNELIRLRRTANELSDEPTLLNSDAEFNSVLGENYYFLKKIKKKI